MRYKTLATGSLALIKAHKLISGIVGAVLVGIIVTAVSISGGRSQYWHEGYSQAQDYGTVQQAALEQGGPLNRNDCATLASQAADAAGIESAIPSEAAWQQFDQGFIAGCLALQ